MVAPNRSREPLTQRQMEVFKIIVRFWGENGRVPTYRETSQIAGFSSVGYSKIIFEILQRRGYVKLVRTPDTEVVTSIIIPGLTDQVSTIADKYLHNLESQELKPEYRSSRRSA